MWEVARLNVAMPGAEAHHLPGQAQQLIGLLQEHTEVRQVLTDTGSRAHICTGGKTSSKKERGERNEGYP